MDDDLMQVHARLAAMRALMLDVAAQVYSQGGVSPETIRASAIEQAEHARETDFGEAEGAAARRYAEAVATRINSLFEDVAVAVEDRAKITAGTIPK